MPKKKKATINNRGGVSPSKCLETFTTSSITHKSENVSRPVTRFSLATAHSQHFLTQAVQFVQSRIMLQVDKVYTSFWQRIAQRDRYTAAMPAPSPYDIGYDHGAAHLPNFMVSDEVEAEQAAYMRTLSQADETEYMRGFMHGFSSQPRQPEMAVAS